MRELPLSRPSVRGLVSLLLSFVLAALTLPLTAQGALAADNDAELGIEAYVTGHQGEIPTVAPGQSFSYTVNLQCSAAKCTDAAVTASLPAPLVFAADAAVTVNPAIADVDTNGQDLTVTFRDGGLDAGTVVMITVKVELPKSASADDNGDAAKMTFTATADNAATVSDSASVALDIPPVLSAHATKTAKPTTTQPAIAGRDVTFTVGGGNTSNVSVESVVIADPSDVSGANAFDKLALTGISTLTAPTGADRVAFSWYDGSTWHSGSAAAIPSDPSDLLSAVTGSGASLADVLGVRFAFSKDGGTLPAGDPAQIVLTTTSRDGAFASLAEGDSLVVVNKVAATVTRAGDSATDTAQAGVTFKMQSVHVDVTKAFADTSLVAGKQTSVTLQAATGVMPTSSITITEPAAGKPTLADQGLTFGAFVTDSNADAQLTWPEGATSAAITYTYADGSTEDRTTTQQHTLPAPTRAAADNAVVAFSVTFSADHDGIAPNATAVVPFTVTAGKVAEEAGTTITNTVGATASATTGSDSDTASDDLTLLPQRVRTSIAKTFNRSSIWASPGSAATIQLTGKVASDSTVGSDHLTLTDGDATFWDHFDLRRILPTDVPSNAILTVEYDDGTSWQQLTAPVTGAADGWTYTLTTAQRAAAQGIRFVFTPKVDGTLLPASFTVVPRLDVVLRSTLRSNSEVSATLGVDAVDNTATSEVANAGAIASPVTEQDAASLTLKPVNGGGGSGGVDLVEKYWLDPDTGDRDTNPGISALSDQQRTVAVRWGTDGLSMSSVAVVDDPSTSPISGSVYNAFNLVRIRPITSATDALISKDKVAKVELYLDGTGWTDITGSACPSASACDGGFPGYQLTAAQQRDTLAARLTFEAGSATDTGTVATGGDAFDRQVRLDFQLRRTLRSDSSAYVLGTSHDYTYNSGERGVVNNVAQVTGTLADGSGKIQSTDAAPITIYDRPLNVSFTKTLDQAALGIPQHAGDTFPLVSATLKATNNTASGVPEIDIADPSTSTSGLAWYQYLNLYQIELKTLPDGITADDVSVTLTTLDGSGTTTQTRTAAEAQSMTPAELASVVGVRVAYGSQGNLSDPAKALIPTDATATTVLTYQLRPTLRNDDGSDGSAMVATSDVINTAQASVISPGGIGCAQAEPSQTCDAPTATDSGEIDIAEPTYTVAAGKSISPSVRYEDEAPGYTVTLTGQPTGTARTQLLTLTDASATFWNAFDLASLSTVTLPAPVNQLRVSVLTGISYSVDGGTLVPVCSGSTDLSACWHASGWQDVDANRQVVPSLPGGITASEVRGVRFEVRSVAGGVPVQWERPADPQVTIRFAATRRTLLVYGTNGALDTPVPSTLPGMATAPGELVQGVTTDDVSVDGLAAWRAQSGNAYTDHSQASSTTMLRHRVNQIKVEKSPGQGTDSEAPRYDLDGTIPYRVTITNTGAWAMTGLSISDQIDLVGGSSPLVPASVDPVFTFTVNGTPVSGFDASLDTGTGAITVTVPSGFVLAAGDVLVFSANLRFRDRLTAGTAVTNTVSVGSGRDFEKCEATLNGEATTPETGTSECSSATTVVAAASTPLTVSKAVKGTGAGDPSAATDAPNHDDLGVIAVGATDASACQDPDSEGYYAAPCTPITRPGGKETWRLSLSNNGNVAANTISAIDVLPAPGDTGVIVNAARKSRWAPTFLGNLHVTGLDGTSAHTLSYYYTTSSPGATCNKADILNDTKPTGQSNCGTTWIPFDDSTAGADLATAKAIKVLVRFTDPTKGLAPGVPFTVTFDTRTPAYAPVADASTVEPVAWNSVAVGSRTADSLTFPARASLVTEPAKVGVAIAGGQLALAKTVVAPTADWTQWLPTTYAATVSCTSLGTTVPLRNSSGSDVSTVQLAADGTVTTYNGTHLVNLPLFSTCSLAETPGQGAAATFQPADAVALRDFSTVANIAHGWSSGSATAALGVTNTYSAAGFTVSKTVPDWPAQYADGTDVLFKDFAYTASCTFLGHEVVPFADRTFSLRDGGSKSFANLPAGAVCTVAETYAAGASASAVSTKQAGHEVDSGTTDTTFTLVAGDADATAVAYTNTYSAGSVVITKSFSGAGADAWGDQDFQVQLVCTHADANPAEVYRATKTLSKAAGLTWTVGHLAANAQCAVTETATGGATGTTISGGTFTVDATQPAQVGITNRFATGSVTVTKQVRANGAATTASPWADGTFPVTLTCTRPVNGTDIAVTVPGSATKSLTKAGGWSVTWTGLPTNAVCSATENVAGITGVTGQPDPTVTVSPAAVTVPDSGTSTISVVNNYRAGKLTITKTLLGAGTSFFSGATFSVSCTLGGTAVFSRSGVAVPAGTLVSAEIGPIPFGSDCTVTETATGGADATPAPQVVTVTQNAATNDVTTVGFTNSFSAGTLTITKALAGAAAGETWATGAKFVVAVSCGLTSTATFTQNVPFVGAGSTTLMNGANPMLFPVGTHCWASETTTGGATSSSVDHTTFATGVVVTAQTDPTVAQPLGITATNTYSYAGLTVSKTVAGTTIAKDENNNSLAYPTSVSFSTKCTFNNGTPSTPLDTSFTITGSGDGTWGSRTFDKLPSGASCTVTETTPAMSPTVTYAISRTGQSVITGTGTSRTFTLVTGGVSDNTAAFTNTYTVGKLQLTKQVIPTASVWATAPFTVSVACTIAYPVTGTSVYKGTYSFSTSSAGYSIALIDNLPRGASCTTTESSAGGANSTTYTNQTVAITSGATVTTTVKNTFSTGSVTISKALKVNGVTTTAEPWASAAYTMTLTCTRTVNGASETVDLSKIAAGATQVLNKANGYAYTWAGLPTGANCTATETSIDYPSGTPAQPAPTVTYSPTQALGVNVGNGTNVPQTVTNDFAFGNVQIVKTLAGDAADTFGTGTFTYSVSCTLDGTSGTVFSRTGITLSKATSLTSAAIGPIPKGAVCTVTETGTAGATSVSPVGGVVVLDAVEAGGTRTAAFTNTFDYAGFTVTKAVDNGGAKHEDGTTDVVYAATYHFSATCTLDGRTVLSVADFTLLDGGSRAFSNLPVGASCSVTETNTGNAHASSVITQNGTSGSTTNGATSAAFVLVPGESPLAGPSPAATVVAFTDTYTVGGLDIAKSVTGAGAAAWGSGPFTVRLLCTLDHDANSSTAEVTVFDSTHSLTGGDTWQVRKLPTAAHCTVSETKAGGANTTTIDVPTPTITAATQTVMVKNTFNTGSVSVTKAIANGLGTLAPWKSATYEFTLACTKDFNGDGTAESFTVPNAVKSVTGPGSVTWTGLPQGAICSATETAITYPAGTPSQPDPNVGSTAAVTVGNGTTVGQTVTNTFSTAKVNIAKTIAGTGATTWGTGPFVFSVSCTLTGSGTVFGPTTVSLTPTSGQTSLTSADLGPIPHGSTCVVSETDAAGAVPTNPADGTVTLTAVPAGSTTTANFTNTFDLAGFTVSKAVESTAVDADGNPIAYDAASFTASCLFRGSEILTNAADRSFTVAAGASKSFTGLPTGASCTVRETGTSGAASTEVTITQGASTATATTTAAFTLVPGGASATTVAFTNHYTVGSLEITKTVTGAGASLWGDGPFELAVTCTLAAANPDQVFTDVAVVSPADPVWTIHNLPTSAQCQVSEPRSGGANTTTMTDAGVASIGSGTTARVEVTNTFTLGAVSVTKKLTVDGNATTDVPWTEGSYTVKLACTRDFDSDGTAEAITIPHGASRTITGAGSVTFTDLPTGATCTVSETASSPVAQSTTISPTGSVTVGAVPASPQAVTVTNNFGTSTLSVLKQLEGAGQASFGNGPFTFTVSCTLDGATDPVYSKTVTLSRVSGSPTTSLRADGLGPVPIGAECTVTETDRGGADATPSPVTLTVAVDASANVATFTNQFSAGTIWLTKTLAGAAKDEAWATGVTFGVLVTCQVEVGSVRGTVFSREVSIAGGVRLNVTDAGGAASRVPLGSHCWIGTETDSQGATSTTLDQHDWNSAAVVTAGSPASLQALELGLTNTYEYAGFTITKAVDNGGATDADGTPITYPANFGFHATCSFNGASVLDRRVTVADGSSQTFDHLPSGASCTTTETDNGHSASTSVRITQAGTAQEAQQAASATFTLVRAGTQPADPSVTSVAFTNHFTTGAVTITKSVTGDGAAAWGDQVFTVQLRCTLDTDADAGTPDAVVFAASKVLSAATSLSWTVGSLATGAACEVSETETGGANTTTITNANFTVGDDPSTPTAVGVGNEYTLGSVLVAKQIQVDGSDSDAEPYASARYQVRLTCQMLVNGAWTAIDIPGDSHAVGDDLDGVRSITGSGSTTYTGLPTGASCQVSEAGAGFDLPADQVSIDHPSLTVGDGTTVRAQVTNNYHTGTLQITKQLQGDGVPDWSDGDFVFSVSCLLSDTDGTDHQVFSRTGIVLNQADGLSSAVLSGIPVGAACTVTETSSGGADVPATPVSVTIVDGQQNVATPTNEFNLGSLRLTLGLTLDGTPTTADPFVGGRYTVEVSCTRSVNGSDQDVTVPGGGTWTFAGPGSHLITGLPVGATCSVRQTGASLTPQDVTYDPEGPGTPSSGSGTVTVTGDNDAPSALGVVDHFLTSTLVVSKEVLGAVGNAVFPFAFDVSCTLSEDGVATPHAVFATTVGLSVAAGLDSAPLGPIPVNSHCVVTETANGGATVSADPAEITISRAGGNHVTMTNTFGVGTVVVTKAITVDGATSAAEPYASGTYTVTLSCTAPVDGETLPIAVPGGASRTITGAGSAEFSGLPLGATCSAAETASSLAIPGDQVTVSPATVTVGEEPAGVTITNDFRTGSLVLNWQVAGVGAQFAGPATFTVDCTLAGASGSVFHQEVTLDPSAQQTRTLSAAAAAVASATFSPIPIGAVCSVTQTSAQGADRLAGIVVATGTVDLEANVVNKYSAGTLTITKKLAGAGASAHSHTTFGFTATCLAPDGTTSYAGRVSVVGAGSVTVTEADGTQKLFPAGTRCWAEESVTGGADGHTVDHSGPATALLVAAGLPDTVQQLVVTAENRFGAVNDLAYTGFAGGGLAVLGILFVTAGAWLVRRRRA